MDLTEVREKIDRIDDQLTDLYAERMDLSREVGLIKDKENKNVDAPEREKAIVNRLAAKFPDDRKVYVKQLYNTIFYTSKAYQNRFIHLSSPTAEAVKKAVANLSAAPVSATVACQGVRGAYSGIAAEKLFEISDITYFKTFEGVFQAVDKNLCKYGVLPIENSTTGSILQVYDLMQKYRFSIVSSVRVQAKHALVAKKGARIEDIKTVVSHEQGILQCAGIIKSLKAEAKVMENTAVAAKFVADGNDNTVAAICSTECAEIYGLSILKTNVQDEGYNYTRFICISKNLEIYKGANKISVMINTAHTPGSLNRVLNRFAALNLNLTKLESRPIRNSDFEFLFYFDFEGDITDPSVQNLIADLENGTDQFVFLGSYKETV